MILCAILGAACNSDALMPLMTTPCPSGVETADCSVATVKHQDDNSYLIMVSVGTSTQHTEIAVTLPAAPVVGTYTNSNASASATKVDATRIGPLGGYTWLNHPTNDTSPYPFTLVLTGVTLSNGTYTVTGPFRTQVSPMIGTPASDETIYVAFSQSKQPGTLRTTPP